MTSGTRVPLFSSPTCQGNYILDTSIERFWEVNRHRDIQRRRPTPVGIFGLGNGASGVRTCLFFEGPRLYNVTCRPFLFPAREVRSKEWQDNRQTGSVAASTI